MPDTPNLFSGKLFDVEHAINIYAYSYITLPPHEIYNKERLKKYSDLISNCHIYLVGLTPRVEFLCASQIDECLIFSFYVGDEERTLKLRLPPGAQLERDDESFWIKLSDGKLIVPKEEDLCIGLHRERPLPFHVLYIGQSYGEDGNRNAIDRLIRHETLQRIALEENSKDLRPQVIMLEIQPDNRMHILFNPFADEKDEDGSRVENALASLFDTTEAEQVSLYEAAMIRYFQPKYNSIFKNSFPSTNLKVLSQCYEKDMAAVIAEFCFDEMPFSLRSDSADMRPYHIAGYNIHKKVERDIFFGVQSGDLENMAN